MKLANLIIKTVDLGVVTALAGTEQNRPILVTRVGDEGWETDWQLILDGDGGVVTDMDKAIEFVRGHDVLSKWGTGLAPLKFALRGASTWDNF